LKDFSGLYIKSFNNLKIFRATFGIGGAIATIAPPWLRTWAEGVHSPGHRRRPTS